VKKVDSFVIKSFTGPLILTFFIVLIILILQFLWMYVDDLAGKGLELKVLAELLFQFSLTFVPMALPLAILLASLMTFGNMGEFLELTALKSSGISLQRIMLPLIILISFICIGSFFFSNYVLPYSNNKSRTLLYDIRRKRPELNIQAGSFYNGIDGFSIKVTSKDTETSRLDKLFIYDHRDKLGNNKVTYADSGYMNITSDTTAMIMTLYNGYSNSEIEERNIQIRDRKYPFRRDSFKVETIIIPLSGFGLDRSNMDILRSNSGMLNLFELNQYIDSMNTMYNARLEANFKDYKTANLYYAINYNYNNVPLDKQDSLFKNNPISFEPWTVFDTLPVIYKKAAINIAIQNIKNASTFLSQKEESLHSEIKHIKLYEVDWHKKFTLSFSCLVFFFIGAPLGAIIRKGGLGTPAVISVLFFIIYYIISLTGEKLVKADIVGSVPGMWIASFVLLPIGIFLTYKATTDSVIMNIETYTSVFVKIKDFIFRYIFKIRNEDSSSFK
jgi:lipopolysaccharide export system permease protein